MLVLSVFSFLLITPRVLDSTQNYEGCFYSSFHLNCSNVGNLRSHLLSVFLHDHFPVNINSVMVFLNIIPHHVYSPINSISNAELLSVD